MLVKTEKGNLEVIINILMKNNTSVYLQVKAVGNDCQFGYCMDGANFIDAGNVVSGDILSTNVAGGFVGCMLGLYATSDNTFK